VTENHPEVRQHPHSLIPIPKPHSIRPHRDNHLRGHRSVASKQSKAKQSVQPLTTSTSHIQKPNGTLPVAETKEESQTTITATPQISQHGAFPPACRLTLGLGPRFRERGSEVPFEPSKPQARSQGSSQERSLGSCKPELYAHVICIPAAPGLTAQKSRHAADGKLRSGRRVTSGEFIVARVGREMPRLGAYCYSRVDLGNHQGKCVAVSRKRHYGEGPRSGGEEFKGCEWPLSALGERDWMAPVNMPSRRKHWVEN
jgi:hypothetical protein